MNIEIFLSMKEKYETIRHHISEIVNNYEDMIKMLNLELKKTPNDKNIIYELDLMTHGKKSYQDKIKQIDVFLNLCNKKAQKILENSICHHDFVDDYIDVDVERSEKITYCKKCNITK